MRKRLDYFAIASGGLKKEDLKYQYREDVTGYLNCVLNSRYRPIELGRLPDGRPFYVSVEQMMYHMHFLAPTRMGKSRLLLYLMQEFMKRGVNVTLVDPSKYGDTAYRLLGICQQLNKPVVFIDLNLYKNPVLNPMHRNDRYGSIKYLDDAFRVTFSSADAANQANISRYLPWTLELLWNAKLSLAEAKYFTDKESYREERQAIFELVEEAERKYGYNFGYDPHSRKIIENAFFNPRMFERYNSTASRLDQLNHPALQALFCGQYSTGLRNQLAHVNTIISLDAHQLTQIRRRLAGTILINEILYNKRTGANHFLFIDEVGQFATFTIADVLDLYGKTGLTLGLSHQSYGQFDHKKILESVKTNTHIKFHFTRKQEARVKLFGMDEVTLRIPDVPDLKGDVELAYEQHPEWYQDRLEVLKSIRKKFYDARQNTSPSVPRTASHRKADSADHSKSRGRRIWEDLPTGNESPGEAGKEKGSEENPPSA